MPEHDHFDLNRRLRDFDHLAPLAGRGIGRLRRPSLDKNAEAKLRLCRIADAIRMRGTNRALYVLRICGRSPSPRPLPAKCGAREKSPMRFNLILLRLRLSHPL